MPVLSETFLLEGGPALAYRFRLAGTLVAERFGFDPRGSDFLTIWSEEDREAIKTLMVLAARGAGALLTCATGCGSRATADEEIEILVLPLVHTAGAVERFIGSMAVLSEPRPRRCEPLALLRIVTGEPIWPDGTVFLPVDAPGARAPAEIAVRRARLVVTDRGQFRVYDGGCGKPIAED